MAAGQLNRTRGAVLGAAKPRRALLGVAVALPLLGVGDCASPPAEASPLHQPSPSAAVSPLHHAAHGSPPPVGEDLEWALALDAYEAAEADVEEAEGSPAEFGDEHGERLGALCGALRRLLRTPAPDRSALTLKIDLAIEHGLGTFAGWGACLATIREDARRLAAAYPGL